MDELRSSSSPIHRGNSGSRENKTLWAGRRTSRDFVAYETVSRWILRDAACSNYHRHVVLSFFGKKSRDAIIVAVGSSFTAGHFAHDAADAILTGIVRSRCKIPGSEAIVEI